MLLDILLCANDFAVDTKQQLKGRMIFETAAAVLPVQKEPTTEEISDHEEDKPLLDQPIAVSSNGVLNVVLKKEKPESIEMIDRRKKYEKYEKELEAYEKYTPNIVDQLMYFSKSLSVKHISILQKKPEKPTPPIEALDGGNENIGIDTIDIKPGDYKNGFFIVFQSKRLSQRYHVQFYYWDEKLQRFVADDMRNEPLRNFLKTSPDIKIHLDLLALTKSDPNYLFLVFEEKDQRKICGKCEEGCCFEAWRANCFDCYYGCYLDIIGRAIGKFKDDPMGTISMIIAGVSKMGKAAAGIPPI